MKPCIYCTPNGRRPAQRCWEVGSFVCSREKGHPGAHAACGKSPDSHPIATWGSPTRDPEQAADLGAMAPRATQHWQWAEKRRARHGDAGCTCTTCELYGALVASGLAGWLEAKAQGPDAEYTTDYDWRRAHGGQEADL